MSPAKPVIDRQNLEKALAYYDRLDSESHGLSGGFANEMIAVLAAARLHLATLPKPEPKFRAVGVLADGRGRVNSASFPRDYVLGIAAKWIHSGNYNSVAVEQVSP